jgi:hypothetical protein
VCVPRTAETVEHVPPGRSPLPTVRLDVTSTRPLIFLIIAHQSRGAVADHIGPLIVRPKGPSAAVVDRPEQAILSPNLMVRTIGEATS